MADATLTGRVENLEKRVELLETLPAKVDILTEKVDSLQVGLNTLRVEFLQFRDETKQEFVRVHADNEDTRRFMRVLHEEVLARFALLDEQRDARNSRKRRKP
jgi:hypothetical protein